MADDHDYHEPTAEELAALATFMPSFTVTEDQSSSSSPNPQKSGEDEDDNDGDGGHEEEEYEYKLFSAPQKVSIQDPVEETYACPVRPIEYYRHLPSATHLANVSACALSGDQVRRQSLIPWCPSRPSRITHVPYHPVPRPTADDGATKGAESIEKEKEKQKRWRPSKVRRVRFKQLREEQRRKAELRMRARTTRGRGGSGLGRGVGRPKTAATTSTARITKEKSGGGGYPRKGPPAV